MAEELSPGDQAEINAAEDILRGYQGTNKFMVSLKEKAEQYRNFRLSHKQATVVIQIADEEHAKAQKAAAAQDDSGEPF